MVLRRFVNIHAEILTQPSSKLSPHKNNLKWHLHWQNVVIKMPIKGTVEAFLFPWK